MKKLLLVSFIILSQYSSIGQIGSIERIKSTCDSVFTQLKTETNADKKAELIISFYLTSLDGFPLLLYDLGQKLLTLGQARNDVMIESAAWSTLAQGYRLTGNYVRALELHRKGVALAEQSGNSAIISFAYNQMGHIYKDRLENEKALSLYRTALQYSKKSNLKNIWFPSMNLASVFLNAGNLDSSLFYAQKALAMVKDRGIFVNQSIIQSTIGSIYSRKGDIHNALKYFNEARNIDNITQSPRYTSITYLAIAEHFKLYKQIDSSIHYCKMSIDAVQNTPSNNLALKPARMLIDYYQNTNADSTVKFWKIYAAANDSLNSTRANQQLQMMTTEEEQRKRDIEAAQVAYQNKIRTGLLLGGLAVFLLIAIILYRNNRQKQKSNTVLEKTLSELKSTQSQLIQSEKMASLGELTAGIAHEIQNPLNFVNNFSEVSNELIDEMNEELDKGEIEEAKAIANEIKQNLEKINHHGKRADAIVKGMLQHSRTSSGQKELTDINALCDEYLRLSYHGLRAKDKSFNAKFETDFDRSLPKINVVPQEIGRVILNLINNAFYAASQPSEGGLLGPDSSKIPTVWVSTKKDGTNILISVRDNGNGIPEKIKGKIFQPFFTTKPTGSGTGLGLSLAYDIVTKGHGGALTVETKEGTGTNFQIKLPIS